MGNSLRFDPDVGHCWFGEKERRGYGADMLVIKEADLEGVSASEFFQLVMHPDTEGCYDTVGVDLAPPDEYWPKGAVVNRIGFKAAAGRLAVNASFVSDTFCDGDEEATALYGPLLTPALQRHGMAVLTVQTDGRASGPYYPEVYFTPERECTLRELFDIGHDVCDLLDASEDGQPTRETAAHLIRGGKAELLLGQPEGPWLDAKSQLYDVSTVAGQISLAQAVSRFANGEQGGAPGVRTSHVPHGRRRRNHLQGGPNITFPPRSCGVTARF